jgi:hypothetical protein
MQIKQAIPALDEENISHLTYKTYVTNIKQYRCVFGSDMTEGFGYGW